MGSISILQSIAMCLIFLGFLAQTEGLKCHVCSYFGANRGDEHCIQSPLPESTLVECHASQHYCSSFKTTEGGKTFTEKNCALANVDKNGCSSGTFTPSQSNTQYTGETCICNSDKCNGASNVQISSIFILMVVGSVVKNIMN